MTLAKYCVFLLLIISADLQASSYGIGSHLAPLSLTDQHDQQGSINDATRMVLYTRDKKSGELLTDALATLSADFLARNKIVYISDISGMPGLIARFIALPAMQKKSFPILLDKEGKDTKNYPVQQDMATVMSVQSLSISNIMYLDSIAAIIKTLNAAAVSNP